MAYDLFLVLAGFIGLLGGADMCVRGSSKIAERLGVSKALVGMTVVAFGTSLPELVVSLIAAYQGEPGIAVGNVIGSNIANITLILGSVTILMPMMIDRSILRNELPLMIGSAFLIFFFAWTGGFSRFEGFLLLGGFAFFMWLSMDRFKSEYDKQRPKITGSWIPDVLLMFGGFIFLVIGGEFVVDGGKSLARGFGVSEWLIGLTIVALGTSLPELATSLVAAYRKELDISMGNLIGSNLFNSLCVLGGAMAIRPAPVSEVELSRDILLMLVISIIIFPFARTGFRIDRGEGGFLLLFYLAFMGSLFLDPEWSLMSVARFLLN